MWYAAPQTLEVVVGESGYNYFYFLCLVKRGDRVGIGSMG